MGKNHWFNGLMVYWFIGLMVYWFNGLMGFPLGKTKPFLESLVQRLRNTGGGIPSRPYICIYIYVSIISLYVHICIYTYIYI